jgi:hypothetical protein
MPWRRWPARTMKHTTLHAVRPRPGWCESAASAPCQRAGRERTSRRRRRRSTPGRRGRMRPHRSPGGFARHRSAVQDVDVRVRACRSSGNPPQSRTPRDRQHRTGQRPPRPLITPAATVAHTVKVTTHNTSTTVAAFHPTPTLIPATARKTSRHPKSPGHGQRPQFRNTIKMAKPQVRSANSCAGVASPCGHCADLLYSSAQSPPRN